MDLSKLKQKLDSLQQKDNGEVKKKDFSLTTYRPQVGKQQIRIVPSAHFPKELFKEMKFYYGIGKKMMTSPLNYGDKDPIDLFCQQLRKDYSKENFFLAKKLEAKIRVFVPVLVRGEEDKGVRLWQFGKNIYEELLSMALDEEIGDYTDIVNGRDITVETIDKANTGTGYNKTTIRPRLKSTPLSEDKDLVEKWLKEQPNPLDEYASLTYSFEDMKKALESYLTPEEEDEISSEEAEGFDDDVEQPKVETKPQSFKLNNVKPKSSKKDEFEELFEKRPLEEGDMEKKDDLPF